MSSQDKMLEINSRKTPDPKTGYNRYSCQDVEELAQADGYSTGYCPFCGDLCIADADQDAVREGWAQRDNEKHKSECLVLFSLQDGS
jgi:hypothetical protein